MRHFETDLTRSAALFKDVVWPVIKCRFGGELVPVESVTDSDMASMIDRRSGIDAWHLSDSDRIRGIASRVQFGRKAWNTFTVRRSRDTGSQTEYEKRRRDIASNQGWLYPHLTVQAFIDDSGEEPKFLAAAASTTETIIQTCDAIEDGKISPPNGGIRRAQNATFFWVSWGFLISQEKPIVVFGT